MIIHVLKVMLTFMLNLLQVRKVIIQNDEGISAYMDGRKVVLPESTSVSEIISFVDCALPCEGITDEDLQSYSGANFYSEYRDGRKTQRSKNCSAIGPVCKGCSMLKKLLRKRKNRTMEAERRPLKKKTPLSYVTKGKVSKELIAKRIEIKKQEKKIRRLEKALEKE